MLWISHWFMRMAVCFCGVRDPARENGYNMTSSSNNQLLRKWDVEQGHQAMGSGIFRVVYDTHRNMVVTYLYKLSKPRAFWSLLFVIQLHLPNCPNHPRWQEGKNKKDSRDSKGTRPPPTVKQSWIIICPKHTLLAVSGSFLAAIMNFLWGKASGRPPTWFLITGNLKSPGFQSKMSEKALDEKWRG